MNDSKQLATLTGSLQRRHNRKLRTPEQEAKDLQELREEMDKANKVQYVYLDILAAWGDSPLDEGEVKDIIKADQHVVKLYALCSSE